MRVQGRVVTPYPLSAAYVVRVPKFAPLPLEKIERLLNRERKAQKRDKGTSWYLAPGWTPDPMFVGGRVYEVSRQTYHGFQWTAERVGECRVLILPEAVMAYLKKIPKFKCSVCGRTATVEVYAHQNYAVGGRCCAAHGRQKLAERQAYEKAQWAAGRTP